MHITGDFLQERKYRIEKLIGKDSYNAVYLATQCLSNKRVIINELCGVYSNETWSAQNKRFLQEGLLSELNHKYIVKCLDIFEENNTVYYVTKFAEGVNLRDYQEGSTRVDLTLRISEQRSITTDLSEWCYGTRMVFIPKNITNRNLEKKYDY